jgi:hypothetical protein
MKRALALLAAGIAGAMIAFFALSFAGGALAQGPGGQPTQPSPGTMPYGQGQMMGRGQMGDQGQMMGRGQMGGQGQMMGGSEQSLVGMAAAELGLTQAQLVAQLGTDGTIADALKAGGVDPAAFIDTFVASRATRLDAAVAAGTLTREDADARLATARSMATARIYQAFTRLGPGGMGAQTGMARPGGMGGQAGRGRSQGQGFVDADGDGVCDLMQTTTQSQ